MNQYRRDVDDFEREGPWIACKGAYHQHYIEGGQIVHISDQPLAVKSVMINMELANQ